MAHPREVSPLPRHFSRRPSTRTRLIRSPPDPRPATCLSARPSLRLPQAPRPPRSPPPNRPLRSRVAPVLDSGAYHPGYGTDRAPETTQRSQDRQASVQDPQSLPPNTPQADQPTPDRPAARNPAPQGTLPGRNQPTTEPDPENQPYNGTGPTTSPTYGARAMRGFGGSSPGKARRALRSRPEGDEDGRRRVATGANHPASRSSAVRRGPGTPAVMLRRGTRASI